VAEAFGMSEELLNQTFKFKKGQLAIARRECELLAIGQCSELVWSTNDKDSIRSSFKMSKSCLDDLQRRAAECLPRLQALSCVAMVRRDESGERLMTALSGLFAALRECGIPIDPTVDMFLDHHIASRAAKLAKRRESKRPEQS
jgi:hypothetical protein